MGRSILLGVLVLATLAYSWMFSLVSVPNERTRAYLAVAITDDATLAVNGPIQRYGPVFDLAAFEGRFFTDKAPGASFVAVPVYAAARLALSDLDIIAIVNLLRTWVMLPIGMVGFWVIRSLLRRLGCSEPCVNITSVAYSLGSCAYHYSTAFYGHAMVATLMLFAMWAWAQIGAFSEQAEPVPTQRRLLLSGLTAGAAAGLAGLIEYQAVVLAALLIIPAMAFPTPVRWKIAAAFVVGALPFAAALLVYNYLAFGGPFELSYHHLVGDALQALHGGGLAGATKPTWEAFKGVLFSWHRGLLTTSPFLALGFIALAWPKLIPGRLRQLIALSALYLLVIVSSSSVWYGGWSFGPRLLLPIVGMLAVSAAYLVDRMVRGTVTGMAVAAASIVGLAQQLLVQATFGELPETLLRPLPDSVLPMLKQGLVSPNLSCKVMTLGIANLVPLMLLGVATAALLLVWSVPRSRARLLGVGGGALVATLAVCAMCGMAPSRSKAQTEEWLTFMRLATTSEVRCARR